MKRTLLASLFAVGLPLIGYADEAPAPVVVAAAPVTTPAPRAARLVGVILSSAQALLWDEERGEYVIHKVGEDLLGGRLVELDADHIVIERGETRDVVEISAPPQMRVAGKRQPRRMPAMIIRSAGESGEQVAAAAPSVAAPSAAAPSVAAPSAATLSVAAPSVAPVVSAPAPVVSAPAMIAQTASPTAAYDPTTLPPPGPTASVAAPAVAAPVVAAPVVVAPAAVASPAAAPVAPAAAAAPAVAPAPAAAGPAPVAAPVAPSATATAPVASSVSPDRKSVTAVVIARAELDRELGDFGALSQNVQVAAQPDGGFRLAQVRGGSFFERIGLRTNDVVLRVDGRPINGVDDASAAYAWLRVTNRFSVDVVRDGRPMTLRYVVAPAQPLTAAAQ